MDSEMAEVSEWFPFDGKDIEEITGGYVNSGVLRSWVSEGRVKADGRARARGGARTFGLHTTAKVALMAELRKSGVSLDLSQHWAEEFWIAHNKSSEVLTTGDIHRHRVYMKKRPYFYAIEPQTRRVSAITYDEANQRSFRDVVKDFGFSVTIIDLVGLLMSIEERSIEMERRAAEKPEKAAAKKPKKAPKPRRARPS